MSDVQRYGIQVHESESDSWRMYANFAFPGEAEACLEALSARGIEARLLASHSQALELLSLAVA